MTDVSNRRREPKGIPTGGRFADEADGRSDASDLNPDPMYIPRRQPDPDPGPVNGHDRKYWASSWALALGLGAGGIGVMFGVVKLGMVLAGWIATLPHPGLVVGALAAVLIPGTLALDPRWRK